MTDDQETEWLNAGFALFNTHSPDPKPFAALLRSGRPMPASARQTLADLLDPPELNFLHCRLELVSTEGKKEGIEFDQEAMQVTTEYQRQMSEGLSHEEAIERAGKKFSMSGRTAARRVAHMRELRRMLVGEE